MAGVVAPEPAGCGAAPIAGDPVPAVCTVEPSARCTTTTTRGATAVGAGAGVVSAAVDCWARARAPTMPNIVAVPSPSAADPRSGGDVATSWWVLGCWRAAASVIVLTAFVLAVVVAVVITVVAGRTGGRRGHWRSDRLVDVGGDAAVRCEAGHEVQGAGAVGERDRQIGRTGLGGAATSTRCWGAPGRVAAPRRCSRRSRCPPCRRRSPGLSRPPPWWRLRRAAATW